MWTELAEPWQVSSGLSWESYCEGSIPIAAVIINPDGAILAQGRNRLGGQTPSSDREIIGGPLAHAELNALLDLDYSTVNPHQLTLYTTVEPCPLCIGAICMAGIKQVHFAARDGWAGSTNLLHASPYLRNKQIAAHGPDNERLETLCICCKWPAKFTSDTQDLPSFSKSGVQGTREVCSWGNGSIEQENWARCVTAVS